MNPDLSDDGRYLARLARLFHVTSRCVFIIHATMSPCLSTQPPRICLAMLPLASVIALPKIHWVSNNAAAQPLDLAKPWEEPRPRSRSGDRRGPHITSIRRIGRFACRTTPRIWWRSPIQPHIPVSTRSRFPRVSCRIDPRDRRRRRSSQASTRGRVRSRAQCRPRIWAGALRAYALGKK